MGSLRDYDFDTGYDEEKTVPEVKTNKVQTDSDSTDFRSELVSLLNKFSKENGSNTPDFILRDYLCDCLKAFDSATKKRTEWCK
jgi:hypothetical protein